MWIAIGACATTATLALALAYAYYTKETPSSPDRGRVRYVPFLVSVRHCLYITVLVCFMLKKHIRHTRGEITQKCRVYYVAH
jgi:hypothetical protein